jgi:hypothetical protein
MRSVRTVRSATKCLRCFEAEKPVGVQALHPELPVQAFDEGIIRWLARPAEVQCHGAHEGPKVELLADEFWPVIEPDRRRWLHSYSAITAMKAMRGRGIPETGIAPLR